MNALSAFMVGFSRTGTLCPRQTQTARSSWLPKIFPR